MDAKERERRFIEIISSWLVSLPFDLKVLFEAADNENLDREARELAVGTIVYVVSPNDFIADRHDSFVSYCDDCIILRMAMQHLVADGSEDIESFTDRFPEFFGSLSDDLAVCKAVMGELYDWLDSKVPSLRKQEYKGKSIPAYLDEEEAGELLYEDQLGFTTEYPVEEETLSDKFKKVSTILEVIRRRKAEEARTE
ncbi:MAG: hypothetical protein AAGC55_07070 [Myxococcota bacterium]